MSSDATFPKLRWPVDLRMEKIDGNEYLVVNCPLGVSPSPLVLIGAVAPIVASFDGAMSIDAIVAKFAPYGVQAPIVQELIALLDNGLFMATPRFFEAEKQMKEEFLHAETRPPSLAGRSYPDVRPLLEAEVDRYLGEGPLVVPATSAPMAGLVSPHIDYRRGGACYGVTYNYLRGLTHDLYLIMGTSHQYSQRLFHLTRKHFENPLGLLRCDREIVDEVALRHGKERSFADEFLHKREHSLELQIPFLSRVAGSPDIMPILVGSFHQMAISGRSPSENEEYESFVGSLTESLRTRMRAGKRICIIAGVDMAHVGQSFGDSSPLTPERMAGIEHRDREYLETIVAQDKARMFAHIAEDGDARRICGFPTMYTIIDLFDRLGIRYKAEVYDYRQAVDYPTECAVTFAGVGLYLQ